MRKLVVLFALLTIGSPIAFTQAVHTLLETMAPFTDLTFRIEPAGDKFLPMEPIPFDITLSNETERPILGHSEIKFVLGHIDLIVTDEQGQSVKIPDIQGIRIDRSPPQKEKIAPGAAFKSREVFYNLYPIFQKTGAYKIQAVFYNTGRQEKLESESLTITIIEPEGREREVFEFLKPLNKHGWLLAGRLPTDEKFTMLEDVVREFADTRYSDQTAYVLARHYQARGNQARARQMLQRLLLKTDFPFQTDVKRLLTKVDGEIK